MVRKRDVEEHAPERDERDGLDRVDDQRRLDDRHDVRPRRKRRPPEPLEDPILAANHGHDRETGEGGRRDAVPEHAGEEIGGAVDAVDLVVAVDRAEQDEEDDRQSNREEGELTASPVEALLAPELVEHEAHVSSSVSER